MAALGSGRFDLDVPHYEVPEAEEVGQALLTSARSLDQLVQRERDFAVNASHELRTPLTAVRLHLEDLRMWTTTSPETSAELAVVLTELTRLDNAVAAFLGRTGRAGPPPRRSWTWAPCSTRWLIDGGRS